VTVVEIAQAALEAAQHLANLADPRYHAAQIEMREAALAEAIERAEDEAQSRRLNLHAAMAAHTEQLDAAIAALRAWVEAREQLFVAREQLEVAHRASMAAGDPGVKPKDTFAERRFRDPEIAKLWDRALAARGRW
jgi:hypothetical protein